jgi:hypothetical protein
MTPCPHRLPRRLLATALAASTCVAATDGLATQAATAPQLRTDPARRIFPAFAAERARPGRPSAPADVLTVTNCADDGPGSLRAAVAAANDNDEIDLSQLTCSRITLTTGAIEVDVDSLTLTGPSRYHLSLDGNHLDRVLIHPANGALTVKRLTIENGRDRATGFHVSGGGCIASAAFLYLDDTSVRSCYAGGEGSYGGALYAYAVTLDHSIVSGSVAKGVHEDAGTAAFGGAIFTYNLDLTASTVSGNRAVHEVRDGRTSYDIGGGIVTIVGGNIRDSTIDSNYSEGRAGGIATFNPLLLSNSTVSGNVAADGAGGGLFMRWPSTVRAVSSTITANRASAGGGAWVEADGSALYSTIVYGNTADPTGSPNLQGRTSLTIAGHHDLIGPGDGSLALPADTLGDDPLLGPLRSNGGPTRTHALAPGSPALDAGSNVDGLAFDQRGAAFSRAYGAAPDIGAFEQGAPVLEPTAVPGLSARVAMLLAALLGGAGLACLRTRTRPTVAERPPRPC